jgi:sec-independent protein translocase protein TatC
MSRRSPEYEETVRHLAGQTGLLEHLVELRDRLVHAFIAVFVCTAVAAAFTPQILQFLIAPYGHKLQVLGPTEGITIYFGVALKAGLVLAMPYLIYQILMFVVPGLEGNEIRYVTWGVPMATLLFVIGASFAWFVMLPVAIGFLSTWQSDIFSTEWQSREYIPFVTSVVFWLGVSFETPLIIFILARLGLVEPRTLLQQWRFAIVIIAIIAALITPTVDPFNMFIVMIPLTLLYGLSILLAFLAARLRRATA